MKHGKRALVLATAAMMTLSVSACSSGGGQGAASEINLWIPTDSSGSTGKYVDAYNEAHPETKVVLREIPFANYDSALNQAFNAKTGPDLAWINGTSFPTFASRGYLAPITEAVGEEGTLAASNFYPNLYESVKWEGVQQALPVDTGTRVLQWNKVLFDKADVAPFDEVVSWDDMISAAQQIQALGKEYQGYCYAGGQNWLAINEDIGPYVRQAGGTFLNEDQTEATLTTPEVLRAFDTYAQLAATGDKSNAVAQSNEKCMEEFGAGTVGMQMAGFWNEPSEEVAENFEIQRSLPKDEMVFSSTGGWLLGIPSYVGDDKYPALKEFLTDMYEPENIVKVTSIFPATEAGRDTATALQDSRYDIYWEILAESADNPIPLNAGLTEQATIIMNALQKVIQGGDSTESVLQQANAELTATLTK